MVPRHCRPLRQRLGPTNKEERDAAYRALGEWGSADAAPVLFELHEGVTDENLKSRAIKAYIRIARQFDMPPAERVAMCRKVLEAAQRDADKRLVLEVLLRYPTDEMQAIAVEATKFPGLKDEASLGIAGDGQRGNQPCGARQGVGTGRA